MLKITNASTVEGSGDGLRILEGSQNDIRPSLPIFSTFEEVVSYFDMNRLGSYYERQNGLTPRCYYGKKHGEDFGTITYVTEDGRVGLIWAFGCRAGWFYLYPSDAQLMYFLKQAPDHIRRVLTNNKKEYKI